VPAFTTRFAPAPTGPLHIGHVVNAVWVWGYARAHGGRVLLRIEDHDRGRCRPEYEDAILDDLDWLGLVPDGIRTEDFRRAPQRQRQSDNQDRYAVRLAELERRGLAYACTCSRTRIARTASTASTESTEPTESTESTESTEPTESTGAGGQEVRYPGTCRAANVPMDATPARRIPMDGVAPECFDDLRLGPRSQNPQSQCGDLLARDRIGNFTYQFAVVVDDIDQGVDLVIRGEDLLDSTGRQLRLAQLLGRAHPIRFLHHPLVRHPDGRKLSKSLGDTGVTAMRDAGESAHAALGRAAGLAGVGHDGAPLAPDELARLFR